MVTRRHSSHAALWLKKSHWYDQEPRRVLLLHAFGHGYSPWSGMVSSFRANSVEKSPEPIDLYEVSLDTVTQQRPGEGPFIDYVQAILPVRHRDVIAPWVPIVILRAPQSAEATSQRGCSIFRADLGVSPKTD